MLDLDLPFLGAAGALQFLSCNSLIIIAMSRKRRVKILAFCCTVHKAQRNFRSIYIRYFECFGKNAIFWEISARPLLGGDPIAPGGDALRLAEAPSQKLQVQ